MIVYMCIYIYMCVCVWDTVVVYGGHSKTFPLKFSKRVCWELLCSLKPCIAQVSRSKAGPRLRKGNCVVACHVVSSTCFCMLVWQFCICFCLPHWQSHAGAVLTFPQANNNLTIIYNNYIPILPKREMFGPNPRKLRAWNAQDSGPKLTP